VISRIEIQRQIEAELLRRVHHLNEAMDLARMEVDHMDCITADASGSADGTLAARKAGAATSEYWRLRTLYAAALLAFTDYVLSGTLPPDFPGPPA